MADNIGSQSMDWTMFQKTKEEQKRLERTYEDLLKTKPYHQFEITVNFWNFWKNFAKDPLVKDCTVSLWKLENYEIARVEWKARLNAGKFEVKDENDKVVSTGTLQMSSNTMSFIMEKLQLGKKYSVEITNRDAESSNPDAAFYISTCPTLPTNIRIDESNSGAICTWDPCKGAGRYKVEIEGGTKYCGRGNTATIPKCDYIIGHRYKIRVKAIGNQKEQKTISEWTDFVTGISQPVIKDPECFENEVKFHWTESPGATQYMVEINDKSNNQSCVSTKITQNSFTTCINHSTNFFIGRYYIIKVTAQQNKKMTSSQAIKEVFLGDDKIPRHVLLTRDVDDPYRTVNIQFDKPMTNARLKEYQVRAIPLSGRIRRTTTCRDTAVKIKYLRSNTKYRIEVTAVYEAGEKSLPSSSIWLKTDEKQSMMKTPSMVNMSGGTGRFHMSGVTFQQQNVTGHQTAVSDTVCDIRSDVTAETDDTDKVSITWEPPSFNQHPEDYRVISYNIELIDHGSTSHGPICADTTNQYKEEFPGLKCGNKTYQVTVKTVYEDIDADTDAITSKASTEDLYTRPTKPKITKNFPNDKDEKLEVEWNASEGANDYKLEVVHDQNKEDPIVHIIDRYTTKWSYPYAEKIGFGSCYKIKLTAISLNGRNNFDETDFKIIAPADLQHIEAIAEDDQIVVKWSKPQLITEFIVQVYVDGDPYREPVETRECSYAVPMNPGKPSSTYSFGVSAKVNELQGDMVKSNNVLSKPSRGQFISIAQAGKCNEIQVSWKKQLKCDFYQVEIKRESLNQPENILIVESEDVENGDEQSCTYLCQSPGGIYAFRVRCQYKSVLGDWSEEKLLQLEQTIQLSPSVCQKHQSDLQKGETDIFPAAESSYLDTKTKQNMSQADAETSNTQELLVKASYNHRKRVKANMEVYHGVLEGVELENIIVKLIMFGKEEEKEKILREIRNLRTLHHKNVVKYIFSNLCNHDENHLTVFIAMEQCCEETLENYMTNSKQNVPFHEKMRYIRGLCDGLSHIHESNIIHRDLKPQNILFRKKEDDTQEIVISDFGLSKKLRSGKSNTSQTNRKGTDGWQAPESYEDDNGKCGKISKKSDIFSLGLIFYYILTNGNHVYGKSSERWRENIRDDKKRNLSEFGEFPDVELARDLIELMLLSKPAERPCIERVKRHPFFWNSKQKLIFYEDVIQYMQYIRLKYVYKSKKSEDDKSGTAQAIGCTQQSKGKGAKLTDEIPLLNLDEGSTNDQRNALKYKNPESAAIYSNKLQDTPDWTKCFEFTERELQTMWKKCPEKGKKESMQVKAFKPFEKSGIRNPDIESSPVLTLVNFIRNRYAHMLEDSSNGDFDLDENELWDFFSSRFPNLFLYVYKRFREHYTKKEKSDKDFTTLIGNYFPGKTNLELSDQ